MSQSAYFADLLIPFCEAASINSKKYDTVLLKRIVASLSYIDNESLHNLLFPDEPFDWIHVKLYLQNVHYSTKDWINFVNLIDFNKEMHPQSSSVSELISSTLAGMRMSIQGKTLNPFDSLRLCYAKGGISPSWDMLCKTFILCSIVDIDSGVVLEHFLEQIPPSTDKALLNKNVQEILKCMSSTFRHTQEDFLHSFCSILVLNDSCHVRSHVLMHSFRAKEELMERKRVTSEAVYLMNERPSLTKILEMQQQNQIEQFKGKKSTLDSFLTFCDDARLPSSTNIQMKRIIYYLKCLPTKYLDSFSASQNCQDEPILYMPKYLPNIVGNDELVLKSLKNTEIITPDLPTLKLFLAKTYFNGIPFVALRQFREACIPSSQGVSVHWSTVFRLYLCIYCKMDIVKDLWSHVWGLNDNAKLNSLKLNYALSNDNSKNSIKVFTENNSIDLDSVIQFCMQNV